MDDLKRVLSTQGVIECELLAEELGFPNFGRLISSHAQRTFEAGMRVATYEPLSNPSRMPNIALPVFYLPTFGLDRDKMDGMWDMFSRGVPLDYTKHDAKLCQKYVAEMDLALSDIMEEPLPSRKPEIVVGHEPNMPLLLSNLFWRGGQITEAVKVMTEGFKSCAGYVIDLIHVLDSAGNEWLAAEPVARVCPGMGPKKGLLK